MWNWTFRLLSRIPRLELVRNASTMTSTKVAVCQMTSVADKAQNMAVVSKLISDAVKDDVKMLFFPEACDYMCASKKETVEAAEPLLGGATVTQYRELAAKHNVWLSMGGVHEKVADEPNKTYNTHILIDNAGNIVQTYRKLHMYDVEIPERNIKLKESDYAMAGSHIVCPVKTPIGNVGLSICYDMRFPELSTALSIMNAEVLTYPSAFTRPTGAAHWHILLRCRAIENQCYVIAAAQAGQHNPKRATYGHALCIDPWGEVLVDCGEDSPCYKVAEISGDKLAEVRRNMPVFAHRRRNVYSLYTLSLRKDLPPEHRECKPSVSEASPSIHSADEVTYQFGHVSIPERCVFYKSDLSYAFVNLRCVTKGHVLIAPLRPAERNQELTDEEATDFYKTIRLVQRLMETVHSANSCTVTIQDGPDAGQTVKHLHCHIMPRKKGDFIENDLIYLELAKHDQFKCGHPCRPPRTLEEMTEEAASLRQALKKMLHDQK